MQQRFWNNSTQDPRPEGVWTGYQQNQLKIVELLTETEEPAEGEDMAGFQREVASSTRVVCLVAELFPFLESADVLDKEREQEMAPQAPVLKPNKIEGGFAVEA
ncbi:unnamed protein product [Sphagnum tenellum]